MAEEKLIPINVILADRSYRLKIRPEEEEQVRKAIKNVNEKILEFKTAYAGKDMQDYIAMCLITYSTQGETSASTDKDNSLEEALARLEAALDNSLA